jgi:cytoskeletal protein CcmA (bactofilin family)
MGQIESIYAKTTICRACGRGFTISKKPVKPPVSAAKPASAPKPLEPPDKLAKTPAPEKGLAGKQAAAPVKQASIASTPSTEPIPESPGWADRFRSLFTRQTVRPITCFRCGADQEISAAAKSVACRQCGAYVDVRDFKISSAHNRVIETQGTIFITKSGELTSPRAVCGQAVIRGPFQGSLICSGTARVRWKGRIIGALEAKELLVERGADVDMARIIRARRVEVCGKLSARIVADVVAVKKRGMLEGSIHAKAINIEKGGFFSGELAIGKQDMTQPELIAAQPKGSEGELFRLGGDDSLRLNPV